VHLYLVVGLQAALEDVGLPAVAKHALVAGLAVPAAFGIGHVSRRAPGLRVILGTAPEQPPAAR
jgi:hypothetical protein